MCAPPSNQHRNIPADKAYVGAGLPAMRPPRYFSDTEVMPSQASQPPIGFLQRRFVTVTKSEMMHLAIYPFSARPLPLSFPATN
ncbi:hypothetical protein EJJ20_00850 [Pseudomonas poae]|nr:hypothetical protein EJJ20_00850 [Pseudomonas poae]